MAVHVVEHPLILHKLGLMREHNVSTKDFRELASELAALLCLFIYGCNDFSLKAQMKPGISRLTLSCSYRC